MDGSLQQADEQKLHTSTNVTATANHTIYAQWTATQYTVTLNAD